MHDQIQVKQCQRQEKGSCLLRDRGDRQVVQRGSGGGQIVMGKDKMKQDK